ncbi:MAG: alpha/beta fold hydrolase [Candidatus Heimdallarchaeaceae archaeon]|jgi:pimeloyl-ACP methyl ester carboxylesterase
MINRFETFMRSQYEDLAESIFFTMSDSTQLRILRSYAPKETRNGYTLFMVAGWGSVVLGWDDVLVEAMQDFDIVYVETREKGSSKIALNTKHDIDRLSTDIAEILQKLKLDKSKLILFGSSFGAVILADGFGKNKFDAALNALVAPAIQIDLPIFLRYFVPIVPHWVMNPVKPIIKQWLRKKKSENPEQLAKYIRVMNEADSRKWKKVALNFLYWKWWSVYAKVENDILLVAAEKDKMHEADITKKIGELMKNSVYVNLETNKNTHTKPIVTLLREQIE